MEHVSKNHEHAGTPLFTIGYERSTINDFADTLKAFHIETVVDIRERPLSRKRGFSKTALANHFQLYAISYIHIAALGCPKTVRDAYKKDGDWMRYTLNFEKHLETQRGSLKELVAHSQNAVCALLCFEADSNYCHRSLVANAVAGMCNAKIVHLKVSD